MSIRTSLMVSGCLLAAAASPRADDDVLLQGFWWDIPAGGTYYDAVGGVAPLLAAAGFTAVWLPSPCKGMSGGFSMGYDLADHADPGLYLQYGSVETRFGSAVELWRCNSLLHQAGLEVYADIVLNHMMGGELEFNPYTGTDTWTKFQYPHGLFEKNFEHFHPNSIHPDNDAPYHSKDFGEDLCFAHPWVRAGLKGWGSWLTDTFGFDGYRLDFVKGIEPWYIEEWLSSGSMSGRFAVGEYWDGNRDLVKQWITDTGGKASAFDFPLFYTLQSMCNNTSGSFDMNGLANAGLVAIDPMRSVTFVENHDTDTHDPIITDKMMAYAFILLSEGYPCVFAKDYFIYGLRPQIDRLISLRKTLAGGTTSILHTSNDLYVAQRNGTASLPGCVLLINDHPTEWKSAWVTTKWASTLLHDHTGQALDESTAADGRVELWAPPRGFTVFAP
jgi:alpha-amylase